jgi:pimeloyl-ACP methyl ester carboxylesterase
VRRFTVVLALSLLWLNTALFARHTAAEVPPTPVVLIHGQGLGPDHTWKSLMLQLEARGYQRGVNLFPLDLIHTHGQDTPQGLLADTGYSAQQLREIIRQTGAPQVDLVGHSRGGLIVRMLTTGDTASLVRRAVTINTPHDGILPAQDIQTILRAAGTPEALRSAIRIPVDLLAGSGALLTMLAREQHFPDHQAALLAIGSTWRPSLPAFLDGHDGIVSLQSQLDWPGARTFFARLGATAGELAAYQHVELGLPLLIWRSPHMQSLQSATTLDQVVQFLSSPVSATPVAPCALCPPAEQETQQPVTRAEFIYQLTRVLSLPEQLGPTPFFDELGHWSLGYVEAARSANLIRGESSRWFGPDRPITLAEAALFIARAKALSISDDDILFPAWQVHPFGWALQAVAQAGILSIEEQHSLPDSTLTSDQVDRMLLLAWPAPTLIQ